MAVSSRRSAVTAKHKVTKKKKAVVHSRHVGHKMTNVRTVNAPKRTW